MKAIAIALALVSFAVNAVAQDPEALERAALESAVRQCWVTIHGNDDGFVPSRCFAASSNDRVNIAAVLRNVRRLAHKLERGEVLVPMTRDRRFAALVLDGHYLR